MDRVKDGIIIIYAENDGDQHYSIVWWTCTEQKINDEETKMLQCPVHEVR